MEADGSSVRHHGVYQSHLQLRYTYSTRLIQLQNQLQQMI